jgi:hypothetical protein
MKEGDIIKAVNQCPVGFDKGRHDLLGPCRISGLLEPNNCALILEINYMDHNDYDYSCNEAILLTGGEICYVPLDILLENFCTINEEEVKECQKEKNL